MKTKLLSGFHSKRTALIIILLALFVAILLWVLLNIFKQGPPAITTPKFINPAPPETTPSRFTQTELAELVDTRLIIPQELNNSGIVTWNLKAPSGFRIQVFAAGLDKARMMAFDADGNLMVTASTAGRVYILPDMDKNGVADENIIFAKNLRYPHGIVTQGNRVIVAEENRVTRLEDTDADLRADINQVLVPNLPTGGNHTSRTVVLDQEGRLYVSVGSSCNVCRDDPRRAAILRFNANGNNETIFAQGLRNAVGMVFHPQTNDLWVTDNGRDWLGDDLPPDEINIIKEDGHYGWPVCYGDKIPDPQLGDIAFCQNTREPAASIQAHSAPLGLRFINSGRLDNNLKDNLLVALHGSWNRSKPTGYKIIRVILDGEKPKVIQDFITGWLQTDGSVWGRPVDIIESQDGTIFISDDKLGVVYRVTLQ